MDDLTYRSPEDAAPAAIGTADGLTVGTAQEMLELARDRLTVVAGLHTVLDVGIGEVRRIQFDLERGRPATLVIVPDQPVNGPQVILVPPEQLPAAAEILTRVGRHLSDGAGSSG